MLETLNQILPLIIFFNAAFFAFSLNRVFAVQKDRSGQ